MKKEFIKTQIIMKDKFATIIIFIIIILIFVVLIFYGVIAWNEYQQSLIMPEIEVAQTVISPKEENKKKEEIEVPQIIEDPLDKIQNSKKEESNYDNVQINKYFYNQLENYSAIIYKAFETNKEKMKTGTYEIQLGDKFSDLLSSSDGKELLKKYYQSAIEAYVYDNPDIFYIDPNKMYLNIQTITKGKNVTYNVYINNGSETNYFIDEISSEEQINQEIANLQSIRNSILQNRTGNTYDDIKMVHDYIINNCEYDTTTSEQNIYNICGVLLNKKAVCEGYAKAFKYLMDGLQIPCTIVLGIATNTGGRTENHAWNYVQINNTWYAIDTTWDDPVSTIGWVSQSAKYKYFLKGSNSILKDHSPNGKFSEDGKLFSYPEISVNDYK